MPPRRRLPDLAKLFDGLDDPVYVVDDRRRLIFVNAACAAWIGKPAEELLGRECRYRTAAPDDDPLTAAADALCPPPSSLSGRYASAEIVAPGGDARRAEFFPLGVTPTGAAAVLAWLPSPPTVAALADEDRRRESEAQRLHAVAARVRRDLATRYAPDRLVGVSPAIVRVRKQIELAAAASTPNVAIVGPGGIGKRHVARTIHALRIASMPAADLSPLVPLDGPTLNAELLQSAIRGMARTSREPARRGDLVIHDVDRMPADAQVELAGFLRLVDLPTRLIVTCREPLEAAAERGAFRADLAGWLTTLVIELPALARRPDDVSPLAQYFLEETNAGDGRQLGGFTSDALDRLAQYAWPGNAAELAEVVAESAAKAEGPLVAVGDLPRRIHLAADAARYAPRAEAPIVLDDYLAEIEKELLRRALARARGNKTKAAGLLGMTRPRFYRRLVQLGLEEGPIVFEQSGDEADEAS